MVFKVLFILAFVLATHLVLTYSFNTQIHDHRPTNLNSNGSYLSAMELPEHNFNVNTISTTGCTLSTSDQNKEVSDQRVVVDFLETVAEGQAVKLHLKQRTSAKQLRKDSVLDYTLRDLNRISTFRRRIIEKKNQKASSRRSNHRHLLQEHLTAKSDDVSVLPGGHLVGSLKSGVSLGSGEYFMDVFIGTPPKHFLLIVDTGSDLNWIQSVPCYDCFEQNGPYYDPKESSSFKNISCHDSRCDLVSSPDPPHPCKGRDQSCPYYYWYGDSSNTTGDFAIETFTVNFTAPDGKSEFKKVENVMFGCGHWNRGLFHGAGGLLGLGRGPLSFSSQLQSLYGHSFSYCLVDRNSDPSVSSKLIFGVDTALLAHPELNFTKLMNGNDNPVDTFYYVDIRSVIVGDETLKIPEETWNMTRDGGGGTIIDSGTTLSYFVEPGYEAIKAAFMKKIKYPLVSDFPVLTPCYNVSGEDKLEIPDFKIQFRDGAIWNFPVQNFFIWIDSEIICLAMLGSKKPGFSIIGNYQQQNFQVIYDTKNSRLGFAPARCADV